MLYITNGVYSCSIGAFLYKPFVLPLVPHYFKYCIYMSLCICILYVENKWNEMKARWDLNKPFFSEGLKREVQ